MLCAMAMPHGSSALLTDGRAWAMILATAFPPPLWGRDREGGSEHDPPIGSHDLAASILRPQVDADALVDELQRIGLAVVETGFQHAGPHHFFVKTLHAGIRHGADT